MPFMMWINVFEIFSRVKTAPALLFVEPDVDEVFLSVYRFCDDLLFLNVDNP